MDVCKIGKGELKCVTNHHRELISNCLAGSIPANWKKYKVPPSWTLSVWIKDFALRVSQVSKIGMYWKNTNDVQNFRVWLGGLWQPAAWLTAIRQNAAANLKKSMEDLVL